MINSTVAIIVDIQVDEGWRCQGDDLVRAESDGDRVLFDRDAIIEYVRDVLTGQETGDPPWRVAHVLPFPGSPPVIPHSHVVFDGHVMRLIPAEKMDARDPRSFARAVCSCGDYTSSVDSPAGATRAWLSHHQAKTAGIGR